jgi:hypothetical protein
VATATIDGGRGGGGGEGGGVGGVMSQSRYDQ